MWDDLDLIAWNRLKHHYGKATNVPGLLRGCASDDAREAAAALDKLDASVYHQGGWICPAAAATLPFLTALASGWAVHHRPAIIGLITRFVAEAARIEPEWVDEAWPDALHRELPHLLALLDDDDPAVRRAIAQLLSKDGLPQEAVTAAIWQRWRAEQDRVTRWDLIIAFGALLERSPDAEDVRAVLHELLDDNDPQTALAAVHALARTESDLPSARVPQLLTAVRDPGIAAWTDAATLGALITRRTGYLLQRDPSAAARFAVALGRGTGRDERIEGLHQTAALLAQWRTVAPEVHEFLIEALSDADAEIRFQAAFLLACVPPVPAAGTLAAHPAGTPTMHAADALAALVADTATRESRQVMTVGDAAAWALVRLGDDRCLPAIRERLAGPRLGFASSGQFSSSAPGTWDGFWLPAADEALTPLAAHAAGLAPAVRVGTSHALCRLLGAWGAASAPAVPQLVALLSRSDLRVTVAAALGGIGPAASDAIDDLRHHMSLPAAAWAYWRITGDPAPALSAFAQVSGHPELRRLGDLGPLAHAETDRLHHLSQSRDHWVRTEAAFAHYRVTGDPSVAVTVLTDVAAPLANGSCLPVMTTALEHLATIEDAAKTARPLVHAVLDNPRRLFSSGGWHVFEVDERLRTAATKLIG